MVRKKTSPQDFRQQLALPLPTLRISGDAIVNLSFLAGAIEAQQGTRVAMEGYKLPVDADISG